MRRPSGHAPVHHQPEPAQTHEARPSPWGMKDATYGFYEDVVLRRTHRNHRHHHHHHHHHHHQLTPYKDSNFYHARADKQEDTQERQRRLETWT